MRFLLHLKHWQLFLLTWGAALLFNFVVLIDMRLMLYAFPVMILLFALGMLGWIWAIATQLHPLVPADAGLKLGRFKVLFRIPVVYMLLLPAVVGYNYYYRSEAADDSGMGIAIALLLLGHLLSMACIVYGLRFAAKTLKSAELQREAHLSEYLGEFFMIWFSVIGVWVLQPRLNLLVRQAELRP
ncbi:hypothetical protein LJY25_15430 [Hymenobacter sp. BT175]|uniref:hypothetical protein n=1 Tax=Hymenobacter translucens TaxID=2886507 RepID=UPI001D0DC0DE|nr:hypothetical protein [Hymenobacter translucens]MCC2547841.1 hypothetical protein [Hymenobacter translucens]